MESKTAYVLSRRVIQNFMDIVILKHIWRSQSTSGYDMIKFLHRRFHMLSSPGTIYSILYSLERQNLIEGNVNQRKRVYRLTAQGETYLKEICVTEKRIHAVFSSIFSEI